MKMHSRLLCWYSVIVSSVAALEAAEVASPSNLFPSPTGSYENKSTTPVSYGTVANVAFKMVQVAERSAPPPTGTTPKTYTCGTTSHFRVVSGGSTTPVFVAAPVDFTIQLTPSAMGLPGVFDLEVLTMSATGLPGGLMLRESPTLQSTGQHTIRQVPSGNFYISSFFDVFTEISADGGATWTPGDAAMHFELTELELMVSTANQLPPAGKTIKIPGKIEFPNLVQVGDLQLQSDGQSITTLPLKGNLYQTTDSGKASGQVSLDGGVTFTPFDCDYTATRKMMGAPKIGEATAFYTQELVALDLSGGTLPAGLRVRESPTKASLGRTSSRRAADGLYRIGSFFDIFTECSLDNGATWSASSEVVRAQYNPKEIGLDKGVRAASVSVLPLKGHFDNGDIPSQEDIVEYPSGTIIRRFGFSMLSSKVAPPALGSPPVDTALSCMVSMEVSGDGGLTFEPFVLPATMTLRINAVAVGAGASAALYDVEVLSLNASGLLGSGLPLMVRESPSLPSRGQTSVRTLPDGQFLIGSFFDIFTELSLDSGATWSSARKSRCYESKKDNEVISATAVYPPPGGVLDCNDGDDIRGPDGVVLRQVKVHAIHNGSSLPPPSGSKTFSFTTLASGELSTDGGATFRAWAGECTGSFSLTSLLDDGAARYFDTELLALDLSGPGLGTVRLRESPTKASLGRTVSRSTPNTSFGTMVRIGVFTEISSDSGATWTPVAGLPLTVRLTPPPELHSFPSLCLPMCGDYVSSEPMQITSGTTLYRMRKRPEVLFQAWEDEINERVIPVTGTLEGDISTDGGATITHFQTSYTETLIMNTARSNSSLITECRDFACTIVSNGATIKIRESPTLPSLGRMTVVKGSGSDLFVGDLMEMQTEVSLDNGLVWSPRSNLWRLALQPAPAQDNAFATRFFPPRDGAFSQEPGAAPVLYWTHAMIRDMTLDAFATSQPLTNTPGTRTISCQCRCKASFDGGQTWTSITVPASVTWTVTPTTIEDKYEFEITALSVVGAPFMLRESPTLPSRGQTSVRSKAPGYEANGTLMDSFFDIFTEISLDGGATWVPSEDACSLRAISSTTGCFDPSKWQPLVGSQRAVDPDYELHFVDTDATISGLTLDGPISVRPDGAAPPPAPGETLKRQCLFNMGLKGRTAASAPPQSSRMKVEVGWNCTRDDALSSTETVLDTEITSFDVVGELPGGMRLRESPTRQSLGRTSLRDAPDGYEVVSFFDIFLELSLDGGQTWHAAIAPLKMETIDASRPKRFGIGGDHDPLPPLAKVSRNILKTYFETGDKPTQVQFTALIDSTVNIIDDRHMLGLREYDVSLEYQAGDTAIYNRVRGRAIVGSDLVIAIGGSDVDSRTVYDVQITQFDMSGGTMPAGMKLRESPTLPSRGRCERVTNPDGSTDVSSFFDVFLEISHDNGTTWSASDLPLHFEATDEIFPSLTHGDQFIPKGSYKQSTPVCCYDGTCAATECSFTSSPSPLPTNPGVPQLFPQITGHLTSSFTRNGASSATVSADVAMDVNLTLVETAGGTRYFDAEVLKFALNGTVVPAEFRLRESPTKASLGHHTVTDIGGGNYRVVSFFDIFTEISVDGGQTWSECDVPLHLDLVAPALDVRLEPSTVLTAGSSTIDFGYLLTGGTATRNILVKDVGIAMVSDFGMARLGPNATDFNFAPLTTTTLAPGEMIKVPVTFTATSAGTRTATLRISSSNSADSPFDITLTARALAPNADDDGDGLTNQQEMNLTTNPLYTPENPGTNPLHNDNDRLAFFRANGLYLASDVHAMNLDVPLLEKLPGSNQFKLIFGVQSSTDLQHFTPFPLSAPQSTINSEGKLEFLFTVPDSTSFFRVQSP